MTIMKKLSSSLLITLLFGLLFSGCTTVDYRSIEYGMTKAEVFDHLQIDEKDQNDALLWSIYSDEHTYDCYFFLLKKCYMDYYFLFRDSRLISIVQNNDLRSFFEFEGFDKDPDLLPHENGFSTLLSPFFPPIPLERIDPSKVDEERKETWSQEPNQGVWMAISMSPIWIPASPIIFPMIINDMKDTKNTLSRQRSIRLGDSFNKVMQTLEEDKKQIIGDPQNYGILIDKHFVNGPSFGFRDNKVIWIRNGFNAYSALPHGHKYRP